MRILLVHNRYRSGSPGGEDVVFDQERALLESAGYEVTTYTRSNDEIAAGDAGQRLRAVRSLMSAGHTRAELGRCMVERRPDIVHIHNLFPLIGPSAYSVCHEAGVPVVQTIHNYRLVCASAIHYRASGPCVECTPENLAPALRHRCYRNSWLATAAVARSIRRTWQVAVREQRVARFIALTEFAAAWLASHGVARERITVKANFMDSMSPREGLRRKHVIFAGRLSEEKGLRTLLRAWQNLRDVPLRLVGDGPLRPWIERFVAQHALPVEVMGMRPRAEVRSLIAEAACLVFPSEWFEGMPMVLLEAMDSNTAIVATRIGGIPEILTNAQQHVLVRPGSPEELVAGIRDILERMSAERNADVPAHPGGGALPPQFSRSRAVQMLGEIYRSTLAEYRCA